jgi:hypothetical protein
VDSGSTGRSPRTERGTLQEMRGKTVTGSLKWDEKGSLRLPCGGSVVSISVVCCVERFVLRAR